MKWFLILGISLGVSSATASEAPGPFLEPAFPFVESTVDFRDWEQLGFPKENLVVRGVIVKLGQNRYACYDTDLLRVAGVWEGEADGRFLSHTSIAAISYDKPKAKAEGGQKNLPKPLGRPIAATGRYFGWSRDLQAGDPRPAPQDRRELGRGPVADSIGKWEGISLEDQRVSIRYRVGGESVEERWEVSPAGDVIRWISGWKQKLVVEEKGVLRFVDAPELPPATPRHWQSFRPWIVSGNYASGTEPMYSFAWKEAVTTTGTLGTSDDAEAVDDVPLPERNPWNRFVRLTALDFFADGTAAACTLDGDVWLISELDESLQQVTWKRFASGLAEPQSLVIVQEQIYVFTRNGLVRLRGTAETGCVFYEVVANQFPQTAETREFPMDVVKKPGGGFYLAKGGQQLTSKGEGAGRIYEISASGKTVREVCNGLRQPYLGIHPKTGLLTATDQQGNFIPSTPIHVVKVGAYYGFPDGARNPSPKEITEATCWIPHEINQSASGQVWAVDTKLPSVNDHLVHLGYFKAAAFKTFFPNDGQAAVVPLPWRFDIPLLKGAVHPKDGSLYLCGMQIWGADAAKRSGLKRIRATGKPTTMPLEVKAHKEGLVLRFAEPLDEFSLAEPGALLVQQWNYKRAASYGSAHYRRDGSPGHEFLPVVGSVLSPDKRSVFLRVDGLGPIMQLQVDWKVNFTNGQTAQNRAAMTIRSLATFDFAKAKMDSSILKAPAVVASAAATSQIPPSAANGLAVAQQMGCLSCHSIDGKMEGMKGPSWHRLYNSEILLTTGNKMTVDVSYLKEAILNPTAKVRKGFDNPDVGMPPYAGILSDSQIESLLLYFKSLAAP
jgi:glucose/arabinose dehydrogenase/mono/diheme cytochrome c family protein